MNYVTAIVYNYDFTLVRRPKGLFDVVWRLRRAGSIRLSASLVNFCHDDLLLCANFYFTSCSTVQK
jgi:hypothetical protein